MATARTLPSWVVLDRIVHFDDADGSSCATLELECVRSEAIGVNVADSVVGSFTLMAELVDPPGLSFLCIRSSEQVSQALGPVQTVELVAAEEGVLVMTISVKGDFCLGYFYLVYDAINLSLVLTPYLSGDATLHTCLLLPFRRDDRTYGLVNMVMRMFFEREDTTGETEDTKGWKQKNKELLSLWLPSSSTPKPSSSQTLPRWRTSQTLPRWRSLEQSSTWEFKEPIYPDAMPSPFETGFNVDFVFSFKGISFWADQFRGLLYCKQSDLLSDHHVQFNFLPLPEGCHHYRMDEDDADMEELPNIYQAVGCSGESVRFVSITYTEDLADRKVTTWVLMPDTFIWKEHSQLCVRDIWEQQQFKRAGIPASAAPMVPILSPHEDDVIYLMMVDFCNMDTVVHMLRLNIHKKLLLSSTRLPSWQHVQVLQFLGSDFSKHLPLAPEKLKRKGEKSRWS